MQWHDACMQAVHSKLSGGCERGVVCAWAFCRTPRVALCGRRVNEVRGQGRGGRGEGMGKMDKKLSGSSELSRVRTFERGQEGGGQRRRETRKGEGGGERRWIKNFREV
jgi:hypothetical protein